MEGYQRNVGSSYYGINCEQMRTDIEKLAMCRCPVEILKPTGEKRYKVVIGRLQYAYQVFEYECKFCRRKHWK